MGNITVLRLALSKVFSFSPAFCGKGRIGISFASITSSFSPFASIRSDFRLHSSDFSKFLHTSIISSGDYSTFSYQAFINANQPINTINISSSVVITFCLFSKCLVLSSPYRGGAIGIVDSSFDVRIEDSIFDHCYSKGSGGAIDLQIYSLDMKRCCGSYNVAYSHGTFISSSTSRISSISDTSCFRNSDFKAGSDACSSMYLASGNHMINSVNVSFGSHINNASAIYLMYPTSTSINRSTILNNSGPSAVVFRSSSSGNSIESCNFVRNSASLCVIFVAEGNWRIVASFFSKNVGILIKFDASGSLVLKNSITDVDASNPALLNDGSVVESEVKTLWIGYFSTGSCQAAQPPPSDSSQAEATNTPKPGIGQLQTILFVSVGVIMCFVVVVGVVVFLTLRRKKKFSLADLGAASEANIYQPVGNGDISFLD